MGSPRQKHTLLSKQYCDDSAILLSHNCNYFWLDRNPACIEYNESLIKSNFLQRTSGRNFISTGQVGLPDSSADANIPRNFLPKEALGVQDLPLLRLVYTIAKHVLCCGGCWAFRGKELVYSDVDSD